MRANAEIFFVGLSFMMFCNSGGAADLSSNIKETMQTRAFIEHSGENEGLARVELHREAGKVRLVEERTPAKGPAQRFDVVFEPESLQVFSWTRRIGDGEKASRTELCFSNGNIEARTFVGDAVKKVSTVKTPAAPWCMAPLIKFYAALCVASNAPMGLVRNVNVTDDGTLKVMEVKIEDKGSETVKVPAGEFLCRSLRLAPQSGMMSALVPPGEMYIGEEGTHPMVKTVISPTRLGPIIDTVLEVYTNEAETSSP